MSPPPAVFPDRDGTLSEDVGNLDRIERLEVRHGTHIGVGARANATR